MKGMPQQYFNAGIDEAQLVITESFIDALSFECLTGRKAISAQGVSGFKECVDSAPNKVREVVLIPDSDEAGKAVLVDMTKYILDKGYRSKAVDLSEALKASEKDINDFLKRKKIRTKSFDQFLNEIVSASPEDGVLITNGNGSYSSARHNLTYKVTGSGANFKAVVFRETNPIYSNVFNIAKSSSRKRFASGDFT
jgi:DNA primase